MKAKDISRLVKIQLERFIETDTNQEPARNLLNFLNLLEPSLEVRVPKWYYFRNKQAFVDCFQNLLSSSSSILEMNSPDTFNLGFIYWGACQLLNNQYCEQAPNLLADLALSPSFKSKFLNIPLTLFMQLEQYYKQQIDAEREKIQATIKATRDNSDSVIWQVVENMILAWENQLSLNKIQEIKIDFPDFDLKPNVLLDNPKEEFLPNTIYLYKQGEFTLFSTMSFFGQKIRDQLIALDKPLIIDDELIDEVRSQNKFASIQLNEQELDVLKSLDLDDKESFKNKLYEINYVFLMLDHKMQLINDLLNQIRALANTPEKLASLLQDLNQQFILLQNIFDFQSQQICKLEQFKKDGAVLLIDNLSSLHQDYFKKSQTLKLSFALFKEKRAEVLSVIAYPKFDLHLSKSALKANDFKLLGCGILFGGLSVPAFTTLLIYSSGLSAHQFLLFNFALMGSFVSLGIGAYLILDFTLKYLASQTHHQETLSFTRQESPHLQITPSP